MVECINCIYSVWDFNAKELKCYPCNKCIYVVKPEFSCNHGKTSNQLIQKTITQKEVIDILYNAIVKADKIMNKQNKVINKVGKRLHKCRKDLKKGMRDYSFLKIKIDKEKEIKKSNNHSTEGVRL